MNRTTTLVSLKNGKLTTNMNYSLCWKNLLLQMHCRLHWVSWHVVLLLQRNVKQKCELKPLSSSLTFIYNYLLCSDYNFQNPFGTTWFQSHTLIFYSSILQFSALIINKSKFLFPTSFIPNSGPPLKMDLPPSTPCQPGDFTCYPSYPPCFIIFKKLSSPIFQVSE